MANATTPVIQINEGNVGIGVTNPNTKLQVAGIVQVVESSNTAFYGGDYVRVFGNQSYGFRNSAGTSVAQISLTGNSYFNGGNVGIGTTGPVNKLGIQVTANSNTKAINIYSLNTSPNSYTSIGSQYSISNTYVESEIRFGNETQSGGGSYLGFVAGGLNSGNTEKMRITSAGNVGIGTTSPVAMLQAGSLAVQGAPCHHVGIGLSNTELGSDLQPLLTVKGNISYGYNNYSSVANTWSNALNFSGYPAGLYQVNICKQSNASAYIIAQVKWSGTAGTVINTVTSFQYGITFSGTQLQSIINTTTASSISAQCLVTYELACV